MLWCHIQEMLLQFLLWHVSVGVVVKRMVHTRHMFGVLQYFGYVVADYYHCALLVCCLKHLVHLFPEPVVHVGVRFVKYHHVWT